MPSTWREGDLWDPGNPGNKERTRRLQMELRQHLLAWDPIGIATVPEAQDEYDCMISPLLHQLHDGRSASEIAVWVNAELRDHFGMSTEPPERAEALAAQLTTWWNAATNSD